MAVPSRNIAVPRHDVRMVKNPGFDVEMVINVRRQGEVIKKHRLPPSSAPDYAQVLLAAALWDGSGPIPPSLREHVEFLTESGILVPSDQVTERVEPEAGLDLDLDLLDFVPERARNEANAIQTQKLVVNPDVAFQRRAKRPAEIAIALPPWYEFPRGPELYWARDPAHRSWAAFRASPELAPVIARLLRGSLTPAALPRSTREMLQHARVLVPGDSLREAHKKWTAEAARQARSLKRSGYAVVRGLLGPLQVAQTRRYLKARERAGYLEYERPIADRVRTSRLQTQNDVLVTHFHRQTAHLIRAVTKENCVASYNLVSRYLPGAELKRHTDRDELGSKCDWSVWNVSCLAESNHGMDVSRSWPLYLGINGKRHEFSLDFGEAVIYAGRNIPHWRHTTPEGHEQTVLLLFYVPFDYPGSV